MLNSSLFVEATLIDRQVTLPNGDVETMHFKQVSHIDWRRFYLAEASADENVKLRSVAKLISISLCEADGTPALTEEQACQLNAMAANALFEAILEVNGKTDSKKD